MSAFLPERVEPLREFGTPDAAEAAMRRLLAAGLNPQLRVTFQGRPNFVLIPKSERDRALALLDEGLDEDSKATEFVLPDGVPLPGRPSTAGEPAPPSEGRYVGPEPEELRDYEPSSSLSEIDDPTHCPSCGSDRVQPLPPRALEVLLGFAAAAFLVGARFGRNAGFSVLAIAWVVVSLLGARLAKFRCANCGRRWR
jgi:rubredoxin